MQTTERLKYTLNVHEYCHFENTSDIYVFIPKTELEAGK